MTSRKDEYRRRKQHAYKEERRRGRDRHGNRGDSDGEKRGPGMTEADTT